MLMLDGYTIWDRIHHTQNSEVYTGTRDSDGLRVILKTYHSSRRDSTNRAAHELQILRRIRSERLVRPIQLVHAQATPVLVVERIKGYPLSRFARAQRPTIRDFLWIALGATEALADVHDARVIHKDVKLSNLMVDPEQMRVWLIDFGIATEFGRAEQTAPPATAEGTMHYIAPEQTGRMGIGVDFRTDLYSLGATLYELLTGEPPFRMKRGVDLVCAHMAQRPKLAHEVAHHVPVALSRIVDKLLQKDPERRYQTARGLASDLEECAKQLQETGEIDDDLPLGTSDASDRLRFPSRLYGRERETEALQQALERVSQGAFECLFLAGPAGIGKSSLPGVLREPLVRNGGYLAETKFDEDRRDRPYAGIADLMESLLCQILASRAERVAEWSARIRAGIGAIVGVLLELAPSLRYLMDECPSLPKVGAKEERERLALAFGRFVRVFAQRSHPLVLFFDDLQWADAGSLGLISSLLRGSPPEALLLIGGYRDNEVGPDHPTVSLLEQAESGSFAAQSFSLAPLGLPDTLALLADALNRSPEETEGLARRVGLKSQHNPLLVRRLMFHLWDRDLIWYEYGRGWVWDEEKLTEADITDDAAAVVAARIDSLSDSAHALIKTASLIGTSFELEILVAVSGVDRLDVLQELMGMVEQGLISPCRDGFKFVHDRLREAAQSRLSSEERSRLHHKVARVYFDRTAPEELPEVAFPLSNHLLRSLDRIEARDRERSIGILRIAGHISLERGSPEAAQSYLGPALNLVAEADWSNDFRPCFELHLDAADALTQTRDFDAADVLLASVLARPLAPLQRALVMAKQITLSSVRVDGRAMDLLLAGLKEFGVRWSKSPGQLRARIAMLLTDFSLRGPIDDGMFPSHTAADPSWLAPLILVRASAGEIGLNSSDLACIAACFVLRSYRRHGVVGSPSLSLATQASASFGRCCNPVRGRRFAAAAEYWIRQDRSPAIEARARVVVQYSWGWVRPRKFILGELDRTLGTLRELGDLEYVYVALHDKASFGGLCGEPLQSVEAWVTDLASHQAPRPPRSTDILAHAYALLRAEQICWEDESSRLSEWLTSIRPEELYALVHILAAHCLNGRCELAFRSAEAMRPELQDRGIIASRLVEFTFYRGFASAVLAGRSNQLMERTGKLRIARQCLRALRRWALPGSDFGHMVSLLAAEIHRARRRTRRALSLYGTAAKEAGEVGYIHHAALAHERAARLLIESDRWMKSLGELDAALELYALWGATGKVSELEAFKIRHGHSPSSTSLSAAAG